MVWLYRSPIPVGRRGGNFLIQKWFLPACATYAKRKGGEGRHPVLGSWFQSSLKKDTATKGESKSFEQTWKSRGWDRLASLSIIRFRNREAFLAQWMRQPNMCSFFSRFFAGSWNVCARYSNNWSVQASKMLSHVFSSVCYNEGRNSLGKKPKMPPLLVQRWTVLLPGWVIWKYWNYLCTLHILLLGQLASGRIVNSQWGRRIQFLYWL